MVEQRKEILSMQNITKIYSNGFIANKDINFTIREGEIHGLVGENGAGKSTLMKVLFGQEIPDSGKIFLRGEEIKISDPLMALDYGIGMVHQHFMLVPSLTVVENMIIGNEPIKGKLFIDRKKALQKVEEISAKYNLPINPHKKIMDLSVSYKQRVEILKILMRETKILLLDEPTAVLTPQETKELFVQLKNLRSQGFTIVFISHKLNEIKEICDRITVLRDGAVVGSSDIEDVTEKDIANMMVGRDVLMDIQKDEVLPTEVLLKARDVEFTNMFGKKALKGVSFDVRGEEIVGIAGVEGNGQTELAEICTGLVKDYDGKVFINERDIKKMSTRQVRSMNVSFVSEDRMTYDMVNNATIEENMIFDRFYKKEYNKLGLLDAKKIKAETDTLIEDYMVACQDGKSEMKTLSGGNMQKVITARECSSDPKLMIVSQPTRGIDIGATEFIRKKLVELRTAGTGVLLFSADLAEIMQISDRILVFHDGEIVAHITDVKNTNENEIGEYMLGLKTQSKDEIGGAVYEN